MSILKKEVVPPKKEISILDYYGNIDIDLLEVDDKIIEFEDVSTSDFSLMFTDYIVGLLSKTQFNDNGGRISGIKRNDYFETSLSNCLLLAPVLKFDKPIKEIFKNTQKDEKGRDIVYFSKYPIEAIGNEEKEKVAMEGNVIDKVIHYVFHHFDNSIHSNYLVTSYNNEEYINATSLVESNYILRNGQSILYHNNYYIKLKPIKWLCDYENNRLVCLDGLIAGIRYSKLDVIIDFKESTVYNFLKNYLLSDLMQFVTVPKLEEVKTDTEIKDNILNMLRELLNNTKLIKDAIDKILIVEDIKVLAKLYGTELIKIKNKEKSIYGSTERELIRNGILPYYVYIEGEINREINKDNKEKENKEIEEVINKLKERVSLINDEAVKNEILLQIEELNQEYLNELFKGKKSYQRIDFTKSLEKVKTNTGEVKLTFIPPRPVLIKELVEKEIAISKRIDREINNNTFRSELSDFEELANDVVKR